MFISKGYNNKDYLFFTNKITGKRAKILSSKAEDILTQFIYNRSAATTPALLTDLENLKTDVLKYANTNVSPGTQLIYKSTFKNLLLITGNKPLGKISFKDIEHYKDVRISTVSNTTLNIEVRTIKAIFNLGIKFGYITSNPAQHVKQLQLPEKEILCFTDTEIKKLLDTIPVGDFKNLVRFVLLTGCRLAELINFQINNIDLEQRVISIVNKPTFKTKTRKIRRLPISQKLLELVNKVIGNEDNVYKLKEQDDYLFTNNKGRMLTDDFVTKRFKYYLRLAGLPEKFHFHCLRHTFITNLLRNGVDIYRVAELAGHSDIETTKRYAHLISDDMRKAVETL